MSNQVQYLENYETTSSYTAGDGLILSESMAQVSSSGTSSATEYGLMFNGTDERVLVSNNNDWQWTSGESYTLEFWIYPGEPQNGGTLHYYINKAPISKDGWVFLWHGLSGYYMFESSAGGFQNMSASIDNTGWHHVAITFADGDQKMYSDGVLSDSNTVAFLNSYNCNDPLDLGYWTANTQFKSCSISSLRLSDTIRYTTTFVPEKTFTADADTLVLYALNENSGTIANNTGDGLGTNGTITNPDWIDSGLGGTGSIVYSTENIDVYRTINWNLSSSAVMYSISSSFGVNDGTVNYQVRSDSSPDWKVYDTGSETFISASYRQRNTEAQLNTNLLTMPCSASWDIRAFLVSNGSQEVEVNTITITYFTGSSSEGSGTPTPTPSASIDDYLRNLTVTHINGSPGVLKI